MKKAVRQKPVINWYRCPLTREQVREVNQKSDALGFAQSTGFLAVIAATGGAVLYAAANWPWYAVLPLLMLHGMCWNFLLNGFHELVHMSVFKTRWLNTFFLRIYSFLGLYNHHWFWSSHTEHHKFTLHPPDDLEVVLPMQITWRNFLSTQIVNPIGVLQRFYEVGRYAVGHFNTEWEHALLDNDPAQRQRVINWARIEIAGHCTIWAVSISMGWWMVPVVTTLANFYGGWLQFLCNTVQHIGLQDDVPDYRLCCRTIILNPVLQFLYWHMNFHTEHHMYASVPCYRLGKLHRMVRHDLPPCPHGLLATWREILHIVKRQRVEPEYEYIPPLPPSGASRRTSSYL